MLRNRLLQVADAVVADCPTVRHLNAIDETGNYGTEIKLTTDAEAASDKQMHLSSEGTLELQAGFKFSSDGTGTLLVENADCPTDNLLSTTATGDAGFVENSTDNYGYDNNGNLISDTDKGITYKYNHLNLPYEATKATDKVEWIYTAEGKK